MPASESLGLVVGLFVDGVVAGLILALLGLGITLIFGLLLIFLFFRNGIVPFVDRYLDEYFDYRNRLAISGGGGT